ncbi:MAG: DUF2945 domain-containing protein [Bdellovibrionaceae bacterium]|nr:DUF2945 domain-containing protein [Pseudobdellovibrionaceae bacterium]
MKSYRAKQKISWKWAGGVVHGNVVEVFYDRVERVLKGKKIVRIGSMEKPAYLVQSISGNFALKLHTELSLELASTKSKSQPTMTIPSKISK